MTKIPKPSSTLPSLTACLILAYLVPYHVHPYKAFFNDWLAFLSVVIVLALLAEEKICDFRLPWLAALPLGLVIVIGIQAGLGLMTYAWDAWLPIAYLLIATLALLLGATISAQPQGAAKLSQALATTHWLAGLVSVILATLQLLGKETLFPDLIMQMPHEGAIRPYANLGQPNQLALLFCLGLAANWWLYQANKLSAIITIGSALLLLWGLAITQSRIGWLIVPLFAGFVWHCRNNQQFKVISPGLIWAFGLSYFLLIALLPSITAGLFEVATTSAEEHIGNGSVRLTLIQQAWQISLNHPWLGAGWYEFGPQQVQNGADFAASNYAQHGHNIVFNFAAELGWPITIVIFTTLSYWFYRCCLHPFTQKSLSKEIAFATLFITAVFIHSLVEFPLWYGYVLIPTAFLLGMVHQEQLGAKVIQVPRNMAFTLSLVVALVLVTVASDYRRVVTGFRALGWENLGLKADEGSTNRPNFTLFPQFYDYFEFAKSPAHIEMSLEQIAFMEHVSRRFGYAPVLMRMSLVYALNNRQDDAVRTMNTLLKLHPQLYAEAYQGWSNLAVGEPQKYADTFKKMVSMPKVD